VLDKQFGTPAIANDGVTSPGRWVGGILKIPGRSTGRGSCEPRPTTCYGDSTTTARYNSQTIIDYVSGEFGNKLLKRAASTGRQGGGQAKTSPQNLQKDEFLA